MVAAQEVGANHPLRTRGRNWEFLPLLPDLKAKTQRMVARTTPEARTVSESRLTPEEARADTDLAESSESGT